MNYNPIVRWRTVLMPLYGVHKYPKLYWESHPWISVQSSFPPYRTLTIKDRLGLE